MVYPDGDLRVAVNGRTWTINRLACTLVAQGSGEEGASPDVEVDAGAGRTTCHNIFLNIRALFKDIAKGLCLSWVTEGGGLYGH